MQTLKVHAETFAPFLISLSSNNLSAVTENLVYLPSRNKSSRH